MDQQRLRDTELMLTRIGLGTWAMGGGDWKFGWGPQDDQESIAAIHRALDLGINWIDTAPAYGLGHCEEIVGKAIAGRASRPLIATKCGRCWDEKRQLFPRLKKEGVRAELHASLKRLGVDVIDLYQMHWPQPDEDIEEAWGAIADFIRDGLVRYAGVSNFNVAQLERLQPIHPVASLQPPYSMLMRAAEKDLVPYCDKHRIGIVAYSPMQKGLLTGKVTREWVAGLAPADHRRGDVQFQEPRLSANLKLVSELGQIAERHSKTMPELAVAWVLRRPEVTAAIVGARRPSQIEGVVGAADWQLTPEDLAEIDAFLEQHAAAA